MNTAKQVNIIIGLLMVGIIGTAFYAMFENGATVFGINFGDRQAQAAVRQEQTNAERGAFLFARNCRACHGLTGQGSAERAGLPGAALNTPANYPPELTPSQLPIRRQRLSSTIECGRVGSQMPAWSTEEGGALNFFQIEQLVTLITSKYAPEGWEEVVAISNGAPTHGGDQLDPRTFLTEAVGANDTTLNLSSVEAISEDQILRIGLETIEDPYELFLVTSVDEDNNTIEVGRGPNVKVGEQILGTDAIEHKAGAEVYNGPILPAGLIIGDPNSEATPPCGQNKAQPATPAQPVDVTNGTAITMGDNFFQVDGENNPQMDVVAGTAITANLTNSGTNIHNMRIAGPDGEYQTDDDIVSSPDQINAGENGTVTFTLAAGTYLYQCDFHPDTMKGELVAE